MHDKIGLHFWDVPSAIFVLLWVFQFENSKKCNLSKVDIASKEIFNFETVLLFFQFVIVLVDKSSKKSFCHLPQKKNYYGSKMLELACKRKFLKQFLYYQSFSLSGENCRNDYSCHGGKEECLWVVESGLNYSFDKLYLKLLEIWMVERKIVRTHSL